MPTPRIEDYRFGRIKVDGEAHTKDLIIRPDGVHAGWWRSAGHSVTLEDLAVALDAAMSMLEFDQGVVYTINLQNKEARLLACREVEKKI